ncbi:hypothetical protein [Priestia megaterium]|nr:hypothetical protein [Priestia megaterium]
MLKGWLVVAVYLTLTWLASSPGHLNVDLFMCLVLSYLVVQVEILKKK